MQISVNGKPQQLEAANLLALLESLAVADKRIAVELNQEICPRSRWAEVELNEGDQIEIVHAIGGG